MSLLVLIEEDTNVVIFKHTVTWDVTKPWHPENKFFKDSATGKMYLVESVEVKGDTMEVRVIT